MNIRMALEQIESAMRAYSAKAPDGSWRVPLEAQRPVYLVGPPGVGKTAAVRQAARRMGVGFAAYTMTHHTRQSALGLPLIAHRTVGGAERAVTEYTMSEIVAEVWAQADAGAERGLLFLDEINCVSESLMPAMLQLLQYKTFGVHALPRGWMLVCAGNPPKYNRYAHTFDAVVLDRLRVIEVEPDLEAWRAYAAERGVHPSIRAYLALRGGDFYASDGDRIVTARSWTDLSDAMLATEAAGDAPGETLFGQYLQVEAIAGRFALYYVLCERLSSQLDGVLAGTPVDLRDAPFDEALFAAMLVSGRLRDQAEALAQLRRRAERLRNFAEGVAREAAGGDAAGVCAAHIDRLEAALAARLRINAIDEAEAARERSLIAVLRRVAAGAPTEADVMDALARCADDAAAPANEAEAALAAAMDHGLDFIEGGVGDPNVRMLFLGDLKRSPAVQAFIRRCCETRFEALVRANDPEVRAFALREE